MEKLIAEIVKALVNDEDDVQVNAVSGGQSLIFEVKVSKDDLGKVIGKNGQTLQALEYLVSRFSGKDRRRYLLEVIKP